MFGSLADDAKQQNGGAYAPPYLLKRGEIMAKITAVAVQTVAAQQNVLFTDDVIGCRNGYIIHRPDSGVVTLRGITNGYFARYLVTFGANVAVPEGGTVGPVSVAISVDGETVGSALATVTPAAAEDLFHVFVADYIDVPRGCCVTLSVRNVGADPITVQNANLIVTREA